MNQMYNNRMNLIIYWALIELQLYCGHDSTWDNSQLRQVYLQVQLCVHTAAWHQ